MPPKKGKEPPAPAAAAEPAKPVRVRGPGSAAAAAAAAAATGQPVLTVWRPTSKRAVRANGGVVGARPDATVGDWVVKEWQRLPKQLLQEWLQREKRPKALYPNARCDAPDRVRVRVVLPDPKGKSEKDISLVPVQDYATRMEAEEFAALLALRHLMPSLPLERKMPEPFATAWTSFGKEIHKPAPTPPPAAAAAPAAASASKAAAASSSSAAAPAAGSSAAAAATPAPAAAAPVIVAPVAASMFASEADRARHQEEQRKRANQRESRQDDREKRWAGVFMSEANRSYIHDILRHLQQQSATHAVDADLDAADQADDSSSDTKDSAAPAASGAASAAVDDAVLKQLEKLGFGRSDAQTAMRSAGGASADVNGALDWLMLNLPEHRLPKQFDPRRQLEVVAHEKDELAVFLGNGRMAVPKPVCEAALKAAKGDLHLALADVFGQLAAVLPGVSTPSGGEARSAAEVTESIEEELTACESIFDKDFTRLGPRHWSVEMKTPALENVSIEILVPPGCNYPDALPVVLVRCDHLSAAQRLQLTMHVMKHIISSDMLGQPLTFELHSWLTGELDALLRLPNLALPKHWQSKQKVLSDEDKRNLARVPVSSPPVPAASSSAAAPSASIATTRANSAAGSSASSEADWDADADVADDTLSVASDTSSVGSSGWKPRPPHNDSTQSAALQRAWEAQKASAAYKEMLRTRQTLPVYKQRQRIIDTCMKNQVVVLSGATGSGKSTQTPQFLLDAMLESAQGSATQILVTQPRRISAIGLAERVADERAEKCGQSVGYRIRGEHKVSPDTRLTFCTTGVLLRQLTSRTPLAKISHIIIDEIHERSTEIDFLLLILKQLLPSYPWMRIVLMSATLDAEVFSSYFGGPSKCPVLSVEGRTFPVEQFWLEDLYEQLQYSPDHTVRAGGLKADEMEQRLAQLRDKLPRPYEPAVLQSLATVRADAIDYRLIEALVWHIVDRKPAGGILIFLPGVWEINKVCGMLERSSQSRNTNEKYWILPLHGALSSSNQHKVFSRAPPTTRKIVVSTNIAETSITVEDVLYVIDSGRMKQVEYDADKKMSALVETFVSQAAANQRKGRAGRVKEGTCYRLFSSVHWSEQLPSHQLPEMHRTALDHVLLQVKLLGLDRSFGSEGLQRVLALCVQPPAPAAVRSAIETLSEAQALDERQALTPLGRHLARLPIDNVRIGKLLLFAAMLGCTTAMTRCAALLGGKPIFLSPADARDEADRKRMAFANGRSDALTQLRAFQQWLDVKEKQGTRAANDFARDNFLSASALDAALQLADSYYKGLEEIGFAAPRGGRRGGGGGGGGEHAEARRLQDDQGESSAVLSAVLTAALYPNVLAVEAPAELYTQGAHGAVPVLQDSKLFKFYRRSADNSNGGGRQRVFLHPRSVNFKAAQYDSPWLTYLSLQASGGSGGDKLVVHDSQLAMPYPLMLFGRSLSTDLARGTVTVDGWMHFRCPPRVAALIRALRTFLNDTLEAKIRQPKIDIRASPVVSAILRIINTNGF